MLNEPPPLPKPKPKRNAERVTTRMQAASQRIHARRRKSARMLWGVATAFCIAGFGTAYAVYVDAQPKAIPTYEEENEAKEGTDLPSVLEISHEWDTREQRWKDRQRILRQKGEKGYDPEMRVLAFQIFDNVREHLRGLATWRLHVRTSKTYRRKLNSDLMEWQALMKSLPARRSFPK